MSARTRLAQIGMERLELLRLVCGECPHTLGRHSGVTDQCGGDLGGKVCRCPGWKDPRAAPTPKESP